MMTTSVGTRAETQVHEQISTSSPIDSEWWAGDDFRKPVHELMSRLSLAFYLMPSGGQVTMASASVATMEMKQGLDTGLLQLC